MNGRRHTDKLPAFALALAVTAAVTIVTRLWRLQTPAQLLDGSKAAAATVSEVRNVGAPEGGSTAMCTGQRKEVRSWSARTFRCPFDTNDPFQMLILPGTDLVLGSRRRS